MSRRSSVLVWVLTLGTLVLQNRVLAASIGVGLDWRKNVFIQEYWKEGKVSYAIANKTDTDQAILVAASRTGEGLAGPWKVKAHSLVFVDASALVGKDLLRIDLENSDSLGLMNSPVQPVESQKTTILSYYGLNGSGGLHHDAWMEQDALTFLPESVVELRLRIPGSKGPLILKKGDIPDIEVSCKTLTVDRTDNQITLDIANPVVAQDAHIVVVKFKAPKVDKETMLTVDTWLWERGKQGGYGITRGVVIKSATETK